MLLLRVYRENSSTKMNMYGVLIKQHHKDYIQTFQFRSCAPIRAAPSLLCLLVKSSYSRICIQLATLRNNEKHITFLPS